MCGLPKSTPKRHLWSMMSLSKLCHVDLGFGVAGGASWEPGPTRGAFDLLTQTLCRSKAQMRLFSHRQRC